MRREPDFFKDMELRLIYVAKTLDEALELEKLLTDGQMDYLVEPDSYAGGVIFRRARVGAFFYVLPEETARARPLMGEHGFRFYEPLDEAR